MTGGLVGATIPPQAFATGHTPPFYDAGMSQAAADQLFMANVSRSLGGTGLHLPVTKKFWNLSDWSTTSNSIAAYGAAGTRVIFALKPLFTTGLPLGSDFTLNGTTAQKNAALAEQAKLANFLSSMTGFGFTSDTARIVLWQEPANSQNFGGAGKIQGPIDYNNMMRTYGSVVAASGLPLYTNVNYDGNVTNATNYANAALGLRAYSGAGAAGLPTVSGVYIDFYTNSYYDAASLRLDSTDVNGDSAEGIADAAGLPFGLAEFGCVPQQIDPGGPPYPKCTVYMQYILSHMKARLVAGKQNLDCVYYMGVGPPTGTGLITSPIAQDPFCTPTGPSEFRVALYQNIWDGLSGVSPSFTQRQTSQNFLAASGVLSMWNNQATPPSGGAASVTGSMLVAKFELGDCTATTTVTGPAGWVQVPHEGKAGTASGQARAQIWYYPNNPGGLYGDASHLAVFTCSNTGAAFKGKIAEWTTPAGTIQALDRSGGTGAIGSTTTPGPVACTATNVFTGDLGLVMFGAVLSGGTTGQGWAAPSGWTGDGSVSNLTQVFQSSNIPALAAGTTSVTGSITLGTWTMTSWAAAVATFDAQSAVTLANATGTLPGGTAGVAYGPVTLIATGGVGPYTFTLASGTLPTGVTLSAGVLAGTPTVAGTYSFHITTTDCSQQSVNTACTVVIAPAGASPLVIGTSSLPGGTEGVVYAASLAVTGGTGPYTWTLT